jgi:hypothetical protein
MAENAAPLSIEDRISAALSTEEPAPAPEPVARPVERQPEAVDGEQVEYIEAEEVEAAPAPVEQAEQAEEEVEIESLDALADHLGVEVADLYNVKFGATDADGNRVDLSIGELKDIYQNREKVSKAQRELETKQREWQAQEQAQRESLIRAEQERANLFAAIEQEYLADYAQVDWHTLEAQDPGRAALARQHFEQRRGKLLAMRNQAAQEFDARQREFYGTLVQQEQQRVQAENAVLAEKIPEWREPAKREELGRKISAFLSSEGYTEDQIFGRRLPDGNRVGGLSARDILLARDAMAWRELKSNGDVAKKKVVKLGKKILTSGPRPSSSDMAQRNEQSMRQRLRKSGSVDDAAALIQSRLGR